MFHSQTTAAANKASCILGLIKKTFNGFNTKSLPIMYSYHWPLNETNLWTITGLAKWYMYMVISPSYIIYLQNLGIPRDNIQEYLYNVKICSESLCHIILME